MVEYDGQTLRSVRESVNVPVRRVARLAKMSHGHLSKVERGEQGRPVTPAILAAYEKATGVRLTDAKIVGFGDGSADTSGAGWRRGRLSDARRNGFNATIAAVAVGGPVGEPTGRLIDAIGRMKVPDRVGPGDVSQVEQAAKLVTAEDLRWGGGLVAQLGRVVLRWAVGLTDAAMTAETHVRLHTAIGHLAHRAAWSAFDADTHDAARTLFTVALDAAIRAKDRNLRAHVLADVGAQHNHLGYPDDCLEIVGMVEGDQRVSPAVRTVLYGVKARAHAAAGDIAECRQHLEWAEQQHTTATADQPEGWLATLCTPGHLYAMTGHAAATLARRTNLDTDREDACLRLTHAVEALDPVTHARARALCISRLAVLHLDAGDYETGADLARQALHTMLQTRSARLVRHLKAIQATANAHPDQPEARRLADDIDAALQPTTEAGPAQPQPAPPAEPAVQLPEPRPIHTADELAQPGMSTPTRSWTSSPTTSAPTAAGER